MTRSHRGVERELILDAASKQAACGYETVRIRGVADAAGISSSAIYHYFPSKDALLLECLHNWLSEFAEDAAVDAVGMTDPYRRLILVTDSLTEKLSLTPRLADTAARAYLRATGAAADEAELVRDMLIKIFADAMRQAPRSRSEHDYQVGALLADLWLVNILAFAQNRATLHDLRQHMRHAVSAIRAHAPSSRRSATLRSAL